MFCDFPSREAGKKGHHPRQFTYTANKSTEDATPLILHAVLNPLEHRDTCQRAPCGFQLYFQRNLPRHPGQQTDSILSPVLGPQTSSQTVRLSTHLSPTRTLRTSSPQGCMLSPLHSTLYTTHCKPVRITNTRAKFADDDRGGGADHVCKASTASDSRAPSSQPTSPGRRPPQRSSNRPSGAHCTEAERQGLQRVVSAAEKIIHCALPFLPCPPPV